MGIVGMISELKRIQKNRIEQAIQYDDVQWNGLLLTFKEPHIKVLEVVYEPEPKTVIYRHIYGESFDAPQLVEPLKDIIFGRAGNVTSLDGMINQIRLFCTIYDPASGRYRFDYSIFIKSAAGLMVMGGTAFVLVRALLANRRTRRRIASHSHPTRPSMGDHGA